MEEKEILVSVCCRAYNHEKYIRQALEGFINQKTSFGFEVLVHDDASTDATAEIIREYERNYPEVIKPIYQKENQYRNGGKIMARFVLPKAKGRYIAFCEGDDFWTDSRKLQMQAEAMEENPDCSVCFNAVEITDIEGEGRGVRLPSENKFGQGVIRNTDYLSFVAFPGVFQYMSFQLSGCMVRTHFLNEYYKESPSFVKVFDVGDLPLFLYMGLKGNAYYIERCMSCYRTGNADSWAGRMQASADKEIKHYETESQGLEAFDSYSDYVVHSSIEEGIRNRKFLILRHKHDIQGLKNGEMKKLYSLLPSRSRIMEHIFHVFPWGEDIWSKLKKRCGRKRA